uniref:Uncharacterized protein n=1 Tax=Salmo trutta TaxID=8032 RepID=A0A674BT64_SALTR
MSVVFRWRGRRLRVCCFQMERSEAACLYCGVSYLIIHKFHALKEQLERGSGERERTQRVQLEEMSEERERTQREQLEKRGSGEMESTEEENEKRSEEGERILKIKK